MKVRGIPLPLPQSCRQLAESAILRDPAAQLRFWSYVDKSNECWEWILPSKRGGYGLFGMKTTKQYGAHRISWILHNQKPVPIGMLICHHCDNPSCVNPAHLFLGTYSDNNRDRHLKGRSKIPRLTSDKAARGERTGNAKMTDSKVLEIRGLHRFGFTGKELATNYGISGRCVGQIVHRETWTHI